MSFEVGDFATWPHAVQPAGPLPGDLPKVRRRVRVRGRSANVSEKVPVLVEKTDKGVRVIANGQPKTDRVITRRRQRVRPPGRRTRTYAYVGAQRRKSEPRARASRTPLGTVLNAYPCTKGGRRMTAPFFGKRRDAEIAEVGER